MKTEREADLCEKLNNASLRTTLNVQLLSSRGSTLRKFTERSFFVASRESNRFLIFKETLSRIETKIVEAPNSSLSN